MYLIFVNYNKNKIMEEISWADFEKVALRVGTIIRVEDFPEARKPAYKLWVDFGPEIGERKSSAQITKHYSVDELIGKQVVGVINFPEKQIGPVISQVLVTGFADENGDVILAVPDKKTPNGAKLH
jgi:tRNA-binding protein